MTRKPTLVLLHAFGASAESWGAVVQALGDEVETLALDLPGFGGRPDDLKAKGVRDYADWVLAEVEQRGLAAFILVGWSMGGKIALAAALHAPEALHGLILVAPSPPGPEPMESGAREAEHKAFADPAAAREALRQVAGDDITEAALDDAVAQRMKATRSAWDFWLDLGSREDISNDVRALNLPITVITGAEDGHLGPQAAAEHVAPYLAGAEFHVIEGSGHLIPYEKPTALARGMLTALKHRPDSK